MPNILDGVRVIDMGVWIVGPLGAAFLADLGADVIHVEQLGVGDPMRGARAFSGQPTGLPHGRHVWIEEVDRNKRDIAVDANKSEGKQIIYDMVKNSDVFLTNLRYSGLEKLNLDYPSLKEYNEKLVYVHSSGFGLQGSMANAPSYDILALAKVGGMLTGRDAETPEYCMAGLADNVTGIVLAYATLAALIAREKYGIGQFVNTSMLASIITALGTHIRGFLLSTAHFAGTVREEANNPLWNWYKCKDGNWIVLAAAQYERFWPIFAQAMGANQLKDDARFNTAEKAMENQGELIRLIDGLFSTKTFDECGSILSAADIPYSRINRIKDLATDKDVIDNKMIVDFDHPVLGMTKALGHPVNFSATPASLRSAAPEYAQHTEEILIEVCGYDYDKILELKDKEVIE